MGMCSDGHTFGRLGHRDDHVVGEVAWVRRGEADPLQPLDVAAGPQQLAESFPVAEFSAVRVHVLTEQRHLQHAVGDQRLHFGEDVARPAVLLLAPQRRHNAEGAGVVAPDRNRHPAGVGRLAAGRQAGGKDLQRLQDLHLRLGVVPRTLQQDGQRVHVVRTEDHVHPRRLADDLAAVLLLRQAAADRDLHAGPAALGRPEHPEIAVELVVRVFAHRAGVEKNNDVRVVRIIPAGADISGLLQQAGYPLGVVNIHLAAECPDCVSTPGRIGG